MADTTAPNKPLEVTVEDQLREVIGRVMTAPVMAPTDLATVQALSVKQALEISAPFLRKIERIKMRHLKSA